jgi:hypothetical protein
MRTTIAYAKREPWPTAPEELLLRAALLRGRAGIAAWVQWKSQVDFDDIDSESYRLVPQLYRNLRDQGVSDPLMGRLKGIYRRTWYQNQLRFHAIARPLRLLHDARIPVALLKGAAVLEHCHRDYGMRPMADFDLYVPGERAPAAIELLLHSGFAPRGAPEDVLRDTVAHPDRHAELEFENGPAGEFDLHWRLFPESLRDDSEEAIWRGAVQTEALGTSVWVLNHADLLLHVLTHGIVRGAVTPETSRVRWVTDGMAIIRASGPALDWQRLCALAGRYGFTPLLRDGLGYLRRTFHAAIPDTVLHELSARPVPFQDRVVHAARTLPPERWGAWLTICIGYVDCALGLPRGAGPLRTLSALPGYYRRRWRARSLWTMPLTFAVRAARRVAWNLAARTTRGTRAA